MPPSTPGERPTTDAAPTAPPPAPQRPPAVGAGPTVPPTVGRQATSAASTPTAPPPRPTRPPSQGSAPVPPGSASVPSQAGTPVPSGSAADATVRNGISGVLPRPATPDAGVSAAPSRRAAESPRFPSLRLDRNSAPDSPPPPVASARFPDAPPVSPADSARDARTSAAPADPGPTLAPPRPAVPPSTDGIVETTARLGQAREEKPAAPAPPAPPVPPAPVPPPRTVPPPATDRPFVSFGRPETYDDHTARPRFLGARVRPRVAAAAACVVLGLGLIGGAVTGSWLTGDAASPSGSPSAFVAAGGLWHSVPVDRLFPATVDGTGAGPGGADRTWTRIAVAPDSGCQDAFDPLLRKALAPVGCLRLLRATYMDATRSHVTTVGLLFTKADTTAMSALKTRFKTENLDRRTDLMPRPYAAKGTVAADFGDDQRASWTLSVLTDAPVVVYAVSGFADGRSVTDPQPAAEAIQSGATTAPAQAGLGHEAQGLADRIERSLRKTVTSATEKPS
ncbi:hypothetical protein ABZS96_30540 [Streptomyces avermitilis]|uniref:hypothetical protein n=1 Tax=Streptomyces avermitilis TaxID=33903 RepID=UPI0033A48D8B